MWKELQCGGVTWKCHSDNYCREDLPHVLNSRGNGDLHHPEPVPVIYLLCKRDGYSQERGSLHPNQTNETCWPRGPSRDAPGTQCHTCVVLEGGKHGAHRIRRKPHTNPMETFYKVPDRYSPTRPSHEDKDRLGASLEGGAEDTEQPPGQQGPHSTLTEKE